MQTETFEIRSTIKAYLDVRGQEPDDFTLRCFRGMLETGDATLADFDAVGGPQLALAVEQWRPDR